MVLKGVLENVESLVSLSSKPEFPFSGRYSSLFDHNLELYLKVPCNDDKVMLGFFCGLKGYASGLSYFSEIHVSHNLINRRKDK